MATTSQLKVFRFSVFELDINTGEFRKKHVKIRLQQQPLQVLVALLERPGYLVTREELKRHLWPEDTFVDFDHSLNAAVNRLREVLDDSATTPRFVETLPRRGYRFIAPVTSESSSPVDSSTVTQSQAEFIADSAAAAPRVRRRTSVGWVVLAGVLVIGAAAAILLASLGRERQSSSGKSASVAGASASMDGDPVRVVPFTSFPGTEFDPAFSPDGREVVFSWSGPNRDNRDIYAKQVGDEDPQKLSTSPDEDYSPAWSPDGRQIAFIQDNGTTSFTVMMVSTRAGPPRPIATFDGMNFVPDGASLPYLTWTPDGRGLIVACPTAVDAPAALFHLSLETRQKRPLTHPPKTSRGDGSPAFSPDGRILAFVRQLGDRSGDVYLVSVDADVRLIGEPRKLARQKRAAGNVVWSADGRELIYPSNDGGISLWRVSADGSAEPRRLALGGAIDMDPTGWGELQTAYSPQARRLIYVRIQRDTDLWRTRLSEPRGKVIDQEVVIRSSSSDAYPSLSPDGQKIAFNSNRSGSNEVWTVNPDGSEPLKVTAFGGPAGGAAVWSPDGTRFALHSSTGGDGEICVTAVTGGPLTCLTEDDADDQIASWSRNGKWIYFASKRSGRSEIWKIPSHGGKAIQLTHRGGFGPSESIDGRAVYYTNAAYHGSIWKIPIDGGAETEVMRQSISYFKNIHVVSDGIYFVPIAQRGQSGLDFFRFSDQRVVRLIDTDREIVGIDVSSDERVIVWSQDAASNSDLVLVENFR